MSWDPYVMQKASDGDRNDRKGEVDFSVDLAPEQLNK